MQLLESNKLYNRVYNKAQECAIKVKYLKQSCKSTNRVQCNETKCFKCVSNKDVLSIQVIRKCQVQNNLPQDDKMSRRHKLMPPLCKTREVRLTDVYCNLVMYRQSKSHMQTVKSLLQVVKELQQACAI